MFLSLRLLLLKRVWMWNIYESGILQDISSLEVDEHGKPGFQGSDQVISISHTDGLVGLQIHTVSHGLDLQIASDKIGRVAHKFCSEGDLTALSPYLDLQATQHFIWGLKECVYKAYGKKGLSYHDLLSGQAESHRPVLHLTSDRDIALLQVF